MRLYFPLISTATISILTFANTSAPFFWLTKMMIGGSTPPFKISINLFLLALSAIMYTTCSTLSTGLPTLPMCTIAGRLR